MPIRPANQPPAPSSAAPSSTQIYRKSADIIRGIEIQYNDPKNQDKDKVILLTDLLRNAIDAKVKASNSFMGKHKTRAQVIDAFEQVLLRFPSPFVFHATIALDQLKRNPGVSLPGGSASPPGGGVSPPMPHIITLSQGALKAAEIRDRSLKSDRVTPEDVTQLNKLITNSGSSLEKQHAAEALRNFSFNADSCETLVGEGLHKKLGQLLIDPTAFPIVKQYAAEAISNLSNDDANYDTLVQDVLAPLLKYINASGRDSYDAQHAMWAMINLTKTSGDKVALQNGVEWQFLQLSKLEASSTGREYPVKAAKLSSNPANHSRLMGDNVHERLKKSLENAAVVPIAKEFAAKALLNLSSDGANIKTLGDGIGTQWVGILVDQQATPRAKEFAAGAICNLARNDAVSTKLIKAGIGTQLIGLLSGDATAKAKDYAAKALLNLSSDPTNLELLVKAGVYAELEKLIKNSNAHAQGAAMNSPRYTPPPVIGTQPPVGNLLSKVADVASNALGTVKEGVAGAVETAQKGVTAGVEAVKKLWPF